MFSSHSKQFYAHFAPGEQFSCANTDSLAWLGLHFWQRFQALTTFLVSLFIWDKYWPFLVPFSSWITFLYSCKYIFSTIFSFWHLIYAFLVTCETRDRSRGSWPSSAGNLCFLQKSFSLSQDFICIWPSLGYTTLYLCLLYWWQIVPRASYYSTAFSCWSEDFSEIIILRPSHCSLWQRYCGKWHMVKFHQRLVSNKTSLFDHMEFQCLFYI